ncbi:N-acetylneuraminate synthase family protein [Hydrocarboniclastica marina]|uniref:N-acetylneuraminic acid synthase n=1 Tax=Hydrocarboniclastica marina TaxID=2259620 RepID=A0A4P7XF19_9ALTE|nr:N-acetylneuraminate synthase family protein [Hydrocarboniclastica marina]MAL97113.1 N-acetylneuraminic acid synthase [Alteromonadaceae bacterium]QCF25521.1 N-acetylneuraminic acid synthase [Hydrocarboniclastica marina]|tara:strand:- start:808 stop:1695 length:888 start_codon:yes stop_codon:yes gene_type:complete
MTVLDSRKPCFIAEVSSNHHRDLQRCLEFIDSAAKSDCDAVKFQLFKIDELFAPEVLAVSESHRARKNWELPLEFLPALKKRCEERGLLFSCTPFYLKGVEELAPYVDFFKIASYELLWSDLLEACARSGLPVVLSTGMASLDEIDQAVACLRRAGAVDITLLHCVSAYPTPPHECNLSVLESFRDRYGVKVGWSDHSVSPAVINRAVHRWGASVIEFHLDLDSTGAEYAAGHCWLPEQIASVVASCRQGKVIDGSPEKQLAPSEESDRDWRADPDDGLRPLRLMRKKILQSGLK